MKKILYLSTLVLFISCTSTESNMEEIEKIKIIGVSMITTNEHGQSYEDTGKLWASYFKLSDQIPNKLSDDIYAIYTDYETDYRGKYTAIIGARVHSLEDIPEGLVGREIGGGKYRKMLAVGEMPQAVVQAWKDIWEKDEELNRRYASDFEVHGSKSQNGENSEVEIYLSVN